MNARAGTIVIQCVIAVALAFTAEVRPASGHEVRPAYLQIAARGDDGYDISWKQPSIEGSAIRLVPHITGGLLENPPGVVQTAPSFQVRVWSRRNADIRELQGRTLYVEGLERTITDVLVSVVEANGAARHEILTARNPSMIFHTPGQGIAVPAYLTLGIKHILTGVDHLSFVLGLVLLMRSRASLISAVTAFTVSHSITLAATALNVIAVRPALVEMLVALSILFVAVELVQTRGGKQGLTGRYPWLIAFTFGLLHGAAFASGLAQIGLPPNAIPQSLLLFNVGVEVGQLTFVAVVLSFIWAINRLLKGLPEWARSIPPYAIGSLAAFWFLDRLNTALR